MTEQFETCECGQKDIVTEDDIVLNHILPYPIFGLSKKDVTIRVGREINIISPNSNGEWVFDLANTKKCYMIQKLFWINKKKYKLDVNKGFKEIDLR